MILNDWAEIIDEGKKKQVDEPPVF